MVACELFESSQQTEPGAAEPGQHKEGRCGKKRQREEGVELPVMLKLVPNGHQALLVRRECRPIQHDVRLPVETCSKRSRIDARCHQAHATQAPNRQAGGEGPTERSSRSYD